VDGAPDLVEREVPEALEVGGEQRRIAPFGRLLVVAQKGIDP
jgi:hypothetical protein